MESFVFIILLGLLILVVLPIWAIVRTFRLEDDQKIRIGGLEAKIRRMEESLEGGRTKRALSKDEKEEPVVFEKKIEVPPPVPKVVSKQEIPLVKAKSIPKETPIFEK